MNRLAQVDVIRHQNLIPDHLPRHLTCISNDSIFQANILVISQLPSPKCTNINRPSNSFQILLAKIQKFTIIVVCIPGLLSHKASCRFLKSLEREEVIVATLKDGSWENNILLISKKRLIWKTRCGTRVFLATKDQHSSGQCFVG